MTADRIPLIPKSIRCNCLECRQQAERKFQKQQRQYRRQRERRKLKSKPAPPAPPITPEITPCHYCGLRANSVDHVPPVSARPAIIEMGLAYRYHFREVPCCRECNSAMNHLAPWTMGLRRQWVKDWIRRRYRHYLAIPNWTEDDLAKLGPRLRAFTVSGMRTRETVEARLAW